jgi:hypothetical protein
VGANGWYSTKAEQHLKGAFAGQFVVLPDEYPRNYYFFILEEVVFAGSERSTGQTLAFGATRQPLAPPTSKITS